jgi:hypothetical protein
MDGDRRPTEEELADLVHRLKRATDDRHRNEPSTPTYHEASRRIESLAQEVWRTAIRDELEAEERAELDEHRPDT